jgi:alanyl-tRNA synthetase
VQNTVNSCIARALPVYDQLVKLDDAKKINALRSVFGEVSVVYLNFYSVGLVVLVVVLVVVLL